MTSHCAPISRGRGDMVRTRRSGRGSRPPGPQARSQSCCDHALGHRSSLVPEADKAVFRRRRWAEGGGGAAAAARRRDELLDRPATDGHRRYQGSGDHGAQENVEHIVRVDVGIDGTGGAERRMSRNWGRADTASHSSGAPERPDDW